MSSPLDEIKRLRAERDGLREQLAGRDQELDDLRGLVAAHIKATAHEHDYDLERERAAYERGKIDGFPIGWVAAEMASEDAHLAGTAHDEHGQVKPRQIPVTREGITAELERAVDVEDYGQRQAEWWFREHQRMHPEPSRQTRQGQAGQLRPKERSAEKEAV
jgi:hypothetical protein